VNPVIIITSEYTTLICCDFLKKKSLFKKKRAFKTNCELELINSTKLSDNLLAQEPVLGDRSLHIGLPWVGRQQEV